MYATEGNSKDKRHFSHYFLVNQVQEPGNIPVAAKKRKAAAKCSLCEHPIKEHKKVSTCRKNQQKQ